VTAINLGRGSPTRLGATYPPTTAEPQLKSRGVPRHSALAYLVLLRVEIARFTRHMGCPKCRLVSVALILTSRWRGVTSYAVLCSPDVPPMRGFPHSDFSIAVSRELHQRRSGKLHDLIIDEF